MKFLIFSILLPSLVIGKLISSTDNWENDDSFTLNGDPTQSPISAKHDPVKVSLYGPFGSTSSYRDKSTTEDPILPLILKKLIEDSINNEINDDNKKRNDSKTLAKTPLTFMTPPPPQTTPSSSSEEDDDSSSTTTQSYSEDNEISTTTDFSDSLEIVDNVDAVTTTKPRQSKKYDTEEKVKTTSDMKTPLKTEQYAEKYQIYLPQLRTTEKVHQTTKYPYDAEEDASHESQETPTEPPTMHLESVSASEPSSHESQDQTPMSPQSQIPETTSENPVEETETVPSPPFMTQPDPNQRPVYYFFLRPKQYRIPLPSMLYNNYPGMSPPTSPYSPNVDSWTRYPQIQPMQTMTYPNTIPTYKFPSYIAQDYENQMPSSQMNSYNNNNLPNQPLYNPINYQQQYSPMYSNYLQQPINPMYQNSYMNQNQMYPMSNNDMSGQSPYSSYMAFRPMLRYSHYPGSFYPYTGNTAAPPYYTTSSTNYGGNGNNYYPSPSSMNMGMIPPPRYYNFNNV